MKTGGEDGKDASAERAAAGQSAAAQNKKFKANRRDSNSVPVTEDFLNYSGGTNGGATAFPDGHPLPIAAKKIKAQLKKLTGAGADASKVMSEFFIDFDSSLLRTVQFVLKHLSR